MIKVTRTITYIYADENTMRSDMSFWSGVENGVIVRLELKTILSETSAPITLPTFTPTKKAEA